jgi:putative membrane protein
MYGGPGPMMGFGWGAWGVFHAIFWLAILVAIAVACIVMIRRSGVDRIGPGTDVRPSALDQLDERYARGEIDREEYLQRKQDIMER